MNLVSNKVLAIQRWCEWRRWFKNHKGEEKQYARLTDMNKQRLMGYAESFRELADSFQEEFSGKCQEAADRQSILEERLLWENRQLIGSNLNEVADIMSQVAEGEICYEPMEEKTQRILVHALRAEGLFAEGFCYLPKEENNTRALGVFLRTEKKNGISADEVADMLSVLLNTRLEASATSPYTVDRNRRSFLFLEEANFITFTGLSRAVKETETLSGDNFALLQSETGKMTVLLSDGTGSGEQANADSGKVLDLMEKMLEAGFGVEAALNMVNSAWLSKGEESKHPTLDVCHMDLYRGDCSFWKMGGALTLLKRGKNVEKICGGTLPLGIFQNPEISTFDRRLEDGDYLIFMTDGVLDALTQGRLGGEDCEELMAQTVGAMSERNPQDMAEKLLQLVLKNSCGHIQDDMTILVVGIWENT